jgi:hypothetical protein
VGKKSGPAAPAAPDPYATAAAQSQSNKETAIANANLNRINQYTPYGNIRYNVTGYNSDGTPKYEQTQTLSDSGQRQLDIQNSLAEQLGTFAGNSVSRVQDAISKPFDMSNLPSQVSSINTGGLPSLQSSATGAPLQYGILNAGDVQKGINSPGVIKSEFDANGNPQSSLNTSGLNSLYDGNVQDKVDFSGLNPLNTDFAQQRNGVENALYSRATARLDPRFNQQQSDMEAALSNQGIARGSEAWNRESTNFNNSRNDAYSSAMNDAIAAGGNEQSRLFGMDLSARQQGVNETLNSGQFANQADQQKFGYAANNRNQAFSEALSGGQFANNAQQQGYAQSLGRSQFNNESQAQQYAQALSGGQFANTAQSQQYDQNAQNAAFYNTASESDFNRNLANVGLNNTARQQGYQEIGNNATLQNSARQQGIAEQSYLRSLPINEIATLLGTTGGIQQPNFQPVSNVNQNGTDVMGAVYDSYNGNMNAWNTQQQQRSQAKGSMFGALGTGAGLAFSDRRIKHTIKQIGELWNGVKTYVFSYNGETQRHFGVMAQEVSHIPDAVVSIDGVLAVDYRKVW